jgi:hypothetical protein
MVALWLKPMASITLKDIPQDIHAQLIREAEANHRSLNGEALRRLELSFDLEAALNSRRDAQWIKEALESGPEEPLTRAKFDAAVKRGLKRAEAKAKAKAA